MQIIPIDDLLTERATILGAWDYDRRPAGLSPRRLPAWTRPQVPETMDVMVRMPSGVRITFETDATEIGFVFLTTTMGQRGRERRPVVFNLESAGAISRAVSLAGNHIWLEVTPGEFELERGAADTVRFGDLADGFKTVALWLPHNAFVEMRELHVNDAAIVRRVASEQPRWLHYGSSISHCMEADDPAYVWPAVAARAAGVDLLSMGFAGQCHLDPFVARSIAAADVDIVSIKNGINVINMDSMRERVYVPALHGFIDTIREKQPELPILLVSPIFCPAAEDHPGPTLPNAAGKFETHPGNEHLRQGCMSLTRVRELMSEFVSRRADPQLFYVDGLTLFGAADADDLPDDLHPNPAGYIRMGERFAPHLERTLAKNAK